MQKAITSKQIAELSGVNASTVSRVFNPDCGYSISESVRKRVLAVAEKYEYVPKTSARSLAHGKSFNLGIILDTLVVDLTSPHFALLLKGFVLEALRRGYQTSLLPVEGEDIDSEIVKQIRGGNADSFFIGSNMARSKTMRELEKRQLPIVIYKAKTEPNLSNVVYHHVDSAAAYHEMFEAIKERGFHEGAFLGISENSIYSNRYNMLSKTKFAGFKIAECLSYSGSTSFFSIRSEATVACIKMFDQIKKHKLIICQNDCVALGLCDAMRLRGMIPGKDISVIGYDNFEASPSAECDKPILATIDHRYCETGIQMAHALIDRLNNADTRNELRIQAEFVPRESLGYN